MSVWDDPEIRVGGDFIKFDQPGDTVSGTIQAVRKHKFENGDVAPEILLVTDQGEEKSVTAGQIRLKNELALQRPEAGDHIVITLTQIEPRAGGKSLKHFAVEVRRGQGQPAAPVAQQQWAPPVQQYAPVPAPQQYGNPAQQAYAPPVQQYAPPVQFQQLAPAAPQQQYAPPAAPAPAPQQYAPPVQQAPAPAPAAAGLSPEQQAAMAALSPEQRAALGFPA